MDVQIKELTLRVVFLGTPGIVCYFILSRLIGQIGKSSIEKFLLIFIFSAISYLLLGVVIAGKSFLLNTPIESNILMNVFDNAGVSYKDILFATLSSIALAYLLSYGYKFNVVNWVGQKIKATNKYGDEDVWHFFQNAPDRYKNDGWVIVRDHKHGLMYYGAVSVFSDSERDRELIISDVTVYDNDSGKKLYELDQIYICRNKDDLSIEVPQKST